MKWLLISHVKEYGVQSTPAVLKFDIKKQCKPVEYCRGRYAIQAGQHARITASMLRSWDLAYLLEFGIQLQFSRGEVLRGNDPVRRDGQ
jgi:hypothetical protein